MKKKKRFRIGVALLMVFFTLYGQWLSLTVSAVEDGNIEQINAGAVDWNLNCRAALLMEAKTGQILFEQKQLSVCIKQIF